MSRLFPSSGFALFLILAMVSVSGSGALPWATASEPPQDDYVSPLDATECLTPDTPCLTIPVVFFRTDTTPSRGISVTFELSPELTLCTGDMDADILPATGPGSWSEGFSQYYFDLIDLGGGRYVADQAVLGLPCGPTTGGELFTIAVAPAVSGETAGTITVIEVLVRDCDNGPLPGEPGPPGTVVIDLVPPVAPTDLTALQRKNGNDSDGTTKIHLSWTDPGGDIAQIEIWRKGFGFYPEYDDAGGAPAAPPVTMANGWTWVATLPSGTTTFVDEPNVRDFWYYASFVTDECGNRSSASPLTGGTLNYHLGDVTDGVTPGQGDNFVSTADMSVLGANYNITLVPDDPLNWLDVGPTTDFSVDALPTTDNRIRFEDLLMFALNFATVSKDFPVLRPAPVGEIALRREGIGRTGDTFEVDVVLGGDGRIQGLSVPLEWDARVVEPVAARAGDLLERQGGENLVLFPDLRAVDAALMGVRERGICGEGVLATFTFRVTAPGDPAIRIGDVVARDAANAAVSLAVGSDTLPGAQPARTELTGTVPNPFNPATTVSFALAREGQVSLKIYSMQGRLVRTLLDEYMPSGSHESTWRGIDDGGRSVSSGTYLVRLTAPEGSWSRPITLLK